MLGVGTSQGRNRLDSFDLCGVLFYVRCGQLFAFGQGNRPDLSRSKTFPLSENAPYSVTAYGAYLVCRRDQKSDNNSKAWLRARKAPALCSSEHARPLALLSGEM